ncbi:MAG: pirin family protein [Anaerolineales bacterium]|nr:pirin family protein [Anaerolineales bacterium]
MLLRVPAESIYFNDYGWHTGRFHFSFADNDDPANTHFGVLSALNEFVLQPGSGFETHKHAEIEIISYCVDGELTHGDSLGHSITLQSGDVQYLSAGSGITHREMNDTRDQSLRFFQIWITPDESGLTPKYDFAQDNWRSSHNILRHVASGEDSADIIRIAQDVNIYAARLANAESLVFINLQNRQSYLVCLEGELLVNEIKIFQNDALKIRGEENLNLSAQEDSHFLLVEMASNHSDSGRIHNHIGVE